MKLRVAALLLTIACAGRAADDTPAVEPAQHALFPTAERFISAPVTLDKDQKRAIEKLSGVRQRENQQPVWRAEAGGQLLGWFIVDEVIGKHEFITYAAALSADGHVIGIDVLAYRETYGGEVRDAAWRKNFAGKTLADPFALDEDIPNLTGATLSSRNISKGVKRLLALQQVALKP